MKKHQNWIQIYPEKRLHYGPFLYRTIFRSFWLFLQINCRIFLSPSFYKSSIFSSHLPRQNLWTSSAEWICSTCYFCRSAKRMSFQGRRHSLNMMAINNSELHCRPTNIDVCDHSIDHSIRPMLTKHTSVSIILSMFDSSKQKRIALPSVRISLDSLYTRSISQVRKLLIIWNHHCAGLRYFVQDYDCISVDRILRIGNYSRILTPSVPARTQICGLSAVGPWRRSVAIFAFISVNRGVPRACAPCTPDEAPNQYSCDHHESQSQRSHDDRKPCPTSWHLKPLKGTGG